jgi:hypothetical protein
MLTTVKYYSFVGSYDGAVKIKRRWTRVVELNRIDKTGWDRVQGPCPEAVAHAVKTQPPQKATVLFPHLVKETKDEDY